MKKLVYILLLLVSTVAFSQSNTITYQAVIYLPSGQNAPGVDVTNLPMTNKNICLQFSFIDANNRVEYQEEIKVKTDEFGMVNLTIGNGEQTGGYASSFDAIVWNATVQKKLQVALDAKGLCNQFELLSSEPIASVPFANASITASNVSGIVTLANGGTGATTAAAARTNLGIGNVDNTSDLNKPISTATKTYVDTAVAGATIVDASTTTKGKIQLAGDLAGSAAAPTVPGLALKENAANKSTTTTLGTSDVLFPTQKAVKTYVDTAVTGATIVDADTATKGKIQLAGDLAGTAAAPTVPGLALKENAANKSTTTTLGTSDVLFPTQKAVKTYVDTAITGATIADADTATKGKIQLAGDLAGTAAAPTVPGLALKENAENKSTTTTLGTSDVLFPTQKAVKTYVDSAIAGATIADADTATKGKIQLAGDLAGTAAVPTVPGLALKENAANKSTTTTLGTSDVLFPTQKAVKTYVDTAIAGATIADADTATKGKIKLAGDLAGTADSPEVATGAISTAKLATNAVTTAKITNASVTNAKLDKANISLSGFAAAAAAVDLGSNKLTNVSNPTSAQDAATKNYVDTAITAATIADADATTKGKIQLAGDLAGTAASPTVPGLALKEDVSNKSTTTTLGTSNSLYPTQNAVKTYADAKVVDGITDAETTTAPSQNAVFDALALKANATDVTTSLALKEDVSNKSTTTTLGTSNSLYPTQNAVKTYVDTAITAATIADADATTKGKIQLAGDLAGTAASPTVPGLALKEDVSNKSTTTTLGTSNSLYPTQNAVKTYADAKVVDGITDAETTTAPSQNAVFDALALKANATDVTTSLALKEDVSNKSTTATLGTSDSLYPTQNAVKTYADAKVVDGITDAETTTAPSQNAVFDALALKANATDVTTSLALKVDAAFKTLNVTTDGASDEKFPSAKAVKTYVDTAISGSSTTAVPYTGATGSVNLGSYDIYAKSAKFIGDIYTIPPTQVGITIPYDNNNYKNNNGLVFHTYIQQAQPTLVSFVATGSVNGNYRSSINFLTRPDGAASPLERLRITAEGKVGIGITAPTATLDVVGSGNFSTDLSVGGTITSGIWNGTEIADTKLATITTAGKVDNSATTATDANTALAIVARDANGDFTAGTITANLTGVASKATSLDGGSLGDIAYQSAANTSSFLSGNTSATKKFLTQTGTGLAAVAPAWGTVGTADITDLGANVATFLATPSSTNLFNAMTNTTGTGSLVFNTSPTLFSPTLGIATATSVAFSGATSGTATIAAPATAGTTTITLPGASGTLATLAGTETLTNKTLTSPILTTPTLGVATATSVGYSGSTSGTATIVAPAIAGTTTITLPGATGTLATLAGAETLTNKTLTSPALTTPALGVATATSINKVTITQPTASATLTIADGKTLTANNSIVLAGTDDKTMTFPTTDATIARTDAAQTFTGVQTFSSDMIVNSVNIGRGNGAIATNTAVGTDAISATATGTENAALGYNALKVVTSGARNAVVGSQAAKALLTGIDNIALGYRALSTATSSESNTAIGSDALKVLGDSTNDRNTAVGTGSFSNLTTGQYNVAVGQGTFLNATSGSNNVGVGKYAGFRDTNDAGVTSSNKSVFIGAETKPLSSTSTNEIVIGYDARGLGNNTMVLGNSLITQAKLFGALNLPDATTSTTATTGALTVAGGAGIAENLNVGGDAKITGTLTVTSGAGAGKVLTSDANGLGTWTTPAGVTTMAAIGSTPNADGATISGVNLNLEPASATYGGVVTTGAQTFAGAKTFSPAVTAASSLGIGTNFTPTLTAAAIGDVLVGLDINPTFTNGSYTGLTNYGLRVQGIGFGRGGGAVVSNIAIGSGTLNNNSSGANNTGLGYRALLSNTTGSGNTALGTFAGAYIAATGSGGNASGTNSTFIGYNTSPLADGDDNEVVIAGGNATTRTVGLGSNSTLIGNAATTQTRIMGALDLPNATESSSSITGALKVAGGVGIAKSLTIGSTTASSSTATGALKVAGGAGIAGNTYIGGTISIAGGTPGAGKVLTSTDNTGIASWATNNSVPYTGATGAVNLGAYDLTVNGLTVGKGTFSVGSNTSIGNAALSSISNATGSSNTAVGYQAAKATTTGGQNTALGSEALRNNTTGIGSVAIGSDALFNAKDANYNIAIGTSAMKSTSIANGYGGDNIAIGTSSLTNITSGSSNIALGSSSGLNITSGSKNIFIGDNAGNKAGAGNNGSNTTGNNSVIIGWNARPSANGNSNEIVLSGYNSVSGDIVGLGTNTTLIGNSATINTKIWGALNLPDATASTSSTTGALTVGGGVGLAGALNVGTTATITGSTTISSTTASSSTTTGALKVGGGVGIVGNTYIGGTLSIAGGSPGAGKVLTSTDSSGIASWATNNSVPYTGATGAVNLGAYDLTVNGLTVGKGLASISTNTAVGLSVLSANTTGNSNTAAGYGSLANNTTGNENVSFGSMALNYNKTGTGNSAFGKSALLSNNLDNGASSGNYNTAFGIESGYKNGTGNNNSFMGSESGRFNISGSNNIMIGFRAGKYYDTVSNNENDGNSGNVLIGVNVRPSSNNDSNEIVISGYSGVAAGSSANTTGLGANTTTIGNSSTQQTKIFGTLTITPSTGIANANGYSTTIAAQSASTTAYNGGNLNLTAGNGVGTGTGGNIVITPGSGGTAGQVQVAGVLKVTGGSPGTGKVLTSDATGVASWTNASGSAVVTGTAGYTITLAESTVFYNGTAAGTFSIPTAASTNLGKEITIKNKSGFNITITPVSGTIYIDNANTGAASVSIGIEASNNWIKLVSDGSQWNVLRALF